MANAIPPRQRILDQPRGPPLLGGNRESPAWGGREGDLLKVKPILAAAWQTLAFE
jgi:hypothetical protein